VGRGFCRREARNYVLALLPGGQGALPLPLSRRRLAALGKGGSVRCLITNFVGRVASELSRWKRRCARKDNAPVIVAALLLWDLWRLYPWTVLWLCQAWRAACFPL